MRNWSSEHCDRSGKRRPSQLPECGGELKPSWTGPKFKKCEMARTLHDGKGTSITSSPEKLRFVLSSICPRFPSRTSRHSWQHCGKKRHYQPRPFNSKF